MATHSSILAWRIPWTEEPDTCSPWGHKELDTTEQSCLLATLPLSFWRSAIVQQFPFTSIYLFVHLLIILFICLFGWS